jgi:hypothetical protein
MYFLNVLALLFFVYLIPGIAIFPVVLRKPLWLMATPILSALVVYLLSTLLIFFGLFQHHVVLSMSLALALLAGVHVYRTGFNISKTKMFLSDHGVFLLINFFVILPFACKLGTHAFDRGDEIYSWNFWAVQHYFSQPADFYHTGAAYPQLLPKLLAWGYQVLGTIDAQLPSKACLVVFPFTLLNAIAYTTFKANAYRLSYLGLLIWGLFGIGLSRYFDNGYADPVMTACLVMSGSLFIQGIRHNNITSLWLSMACGLAASFTKQPALIWSLWGLPLGLALFHAKSDRRTIMCIIALSILGALTWFIAEGSTFLNNQGVLSASIADRSLIAQFYFAVNQYLFQKPLLFLLLLGTAFWVRTDRVLAFMFYGFILPSLCVWFIAGAYHLRLGQHIIAFCMLLIWASDLTLPVVQRLKQAGKYVVGTAAILSITLSGWIVLQAHLSNGGIPWDKPGLITMKRYFPKDTEKLYARLYNKPELLLWVPTRYLYGIFYAHTAVMEPDYNRFKQYNKADLLTELLEASPDYVFTADAAVAQGAAPVELAQLIADCPNWFNELPVGSNKYNYRIYALDLTHSCEQVN